ncbi:unnamed protein product [Amoebophrya sp. A25]|nr:unnamed protein product [Amoebophrya sp. A25]|eukprot:GSA25T00020716001.1
MQSVAFYLAVLMPVLGGLVLLRMYYVYRREKSAALAQDERRPPLRILGGPAAAARLQAFSTSIFTAPLRALLYKLVHRRGSKRDRRKAGDNQSAEDVEQGAGELEGERAGEVAQPGHAAKKNTKKNSNNMKMKGANQQRDEETATTTKTSTKQGPEVKRTVSEVYKTKIAAARGTRVEDTTRGIDEIDERDAEEALALEEEHHYDNYLSSPSSPPPKILLLKSPSVKKMEHQNKQSSSTGNINLRSLSRSKEEERASSSSDCVKTTTRASSKRRGSKRQQEIENQVVALSNVDQGLGQGQQGGTGVQQLRGISAIIKDSEAALNIITPRGRRLPHQQGGAASTVGERQRASAIIRGGEGVEKQRTPRRGSK